MRKIMLFALMIVSMVSGYAQDSKSEKPVLMRVLCKVSESSKPGINLNDVTFDIFMLPDTVKIGRGGAMSDSKGVTVENVMSVGRYSARIYKINIEWPKDTKVVNGVTVSDNVKITESDAYEPQWVEFEITDEDLKKGEKYIGHVVLRKKGAFKAPKPESVSRKQ